MGVDKNVIHYTDNTNMEYEDEWGKAVLRYLETDYNADGKQYEVKVGNTVYKILKREKVTAFYDTNGNTLFDVTNERLRGEYEDLHIEGVPQSAIGKTIASIEKQAFEQAVKNDTDKKNNNEDIASKDCDGSVAGAVTKLQEELKKAKEKDFAKPVIEHLIERCKDSESLASDICQDHKTWEKCSKYIYDCARKQAQGNYCAVRDDVVYEWAEDYYYKDDKEEDENKAKEAAERAKKNKENEKKRVSAKAGTVAKDSKPATTQEKTEVSKTKPETKPKKNSKDMDGQMDLFSMMGM